MSFHQSVVVSGPVDAGLKQAILTAARSRWPFIRPPREDRLPQHAHFAPPELTEDLFATEEQRTLAWEQYGEVEDYLMEWAEQFPDVPFVWVEADCRDGNCLYRGFVCKFGVLLEWRGDGGLDDHVLLLDYAGITLEGGYFAPFERGYFEDR
jgi:hypothetical protein